MASSHYTDPDLRNPLSTYVLGFLGVAFGFLLLPKTLKFVVRRFVMSVLGEVVAIVITGLLTEKAVEAISDTKKGAARF